MNAEARFWLYVDKTGPRHPTLGTSCWLWTGARYVHPRVRDRKTYGHFGFGKGRTGYAHRLAWEMIRGPVPSQNPRLFVLHRCDNPPCVNPDHLFLGTQVDNINDCVSKGRKRPTRGAAHKLAKLTDVKVVELRAMRANGSTWQAIAKHFGISTVTARMAALRETWAHVR